MRNGTHRARHSYGLVDIRTGDDTCSHSNRRTWLYDHGDTHTNADGSPSGFARKTCFAGSSNEFSLQGLVALIRKILFLTFSFELIGVMLFSIRFIPEFGFAEGLYKSVFHSVSAFCNAGFDVMGNFTSFTAYGDDFLVNLTLIMLIIIGGIGFTVLIDIGNKKNFKNLSLHSKVVLVMTGVLLLVGFLFFFVLEYSNKKTLGSGDLNFLEKMMAAFFQSVTSRTAGFNTIDQNGLSMPSKFMTSILMFIGASPAGTGVESKLLRSPLCC